MDLSLLTTSKSKINNVGQVVNGRFIATSDGAGFFYEMGDNRYKVNNVEFITVNTDITSSTPGVTETLYFNTTDRVLYAWNSTSGQLEPVTSSDEGVIKFTAPTLSTTFADATWAEIVEIAESGLAPAVFKVGETKNITDTNINSWTVQIVGFNHDDKTDGSGKAAITFRVFPTNYREDPIISSYYDSWEANVTPGYIGSKLESQIATHSASVFSALGIADNVKPVDKQTYNTQAGDVLSTTSMTAFAFSSTEIAKSGSPLYGSDLFYPFGDEGNPYDYFKNSLLKTNSVDSRLSFYWWTRSFCSQFTSNGNFCAIANSSIQGIGYSYEYGVVFGFCI